MNQNLGVSTDTATHSNTHTQPMTSPSSNNSLIDGILELAHLGWKPIEVERTYNAAARLAAGQPTSSGQQ